MRPSSGLRLPGALPVVLTGAFTLAPAMAPAADVVEEFEKILRQAPDPDNEARVKEHQKLLKQKAGAIVRPGDLRRVLLLPQLRGHGGPPQEAAPEEDSPFAKTYREMWGELSQRLKAVLRHSLHSEDTGRRLAAVTFLAVMAEDEEQTGGPNPAAVGRATVWPRFTAGMAEDLRKVLADDKDAAVCAAAAGAVVAINSVAKETLDALKPLLAPKRRAVERRAAAEGLGRMVRELIAVGRGAGGPPGPEAPRPPALDRLGPEVVAAAGAGLGDEDAAVRRSCLDAIRQAARFLGDNRALPLSLVRAVNARVPDVTGQLDEGNESLRLSALRVLEAIATARRVLQGGQDELGGSARPPQDAALLDGILEAVPTLAKGLDHKEVRMRLGALYVLETLDDGAAGAADAVAGALKGEKKDKNGFVRWAAARVLHNMAPQAPERAVPALAAALADDNATVRLTAATALRRYGEKAAPAVGPLGKAVGDAEPRVRAAAIRALAAVGEKAGTQSAVLVRALKEDKTPAVRAAAAEALGRLGRLPDGAAEALRGALHDPEADVRRAAGDALLDAPSR